ncbi:pyridoxal phosphate-dependent aminotransferase [Agromyces atrinae]|uniref:Aminotransferase n=1 Tax=Agromyces atrinae TaxID=592376 RepID=A0A4Q2MBA1_9MICO|nr:aminotransferase class I/II-fold pyridoxal phosphate-dependent enzyme [Agromyces atrinae]NYD68099.1 aspartate/methionine/tyrosine aminotransferase [Agromyces atrinae]RXZ87753.1 aminotransferase class I/II-fold pyridoxal phosphate-dependent enzyme [Agromyces atrinae]
MPHATTPASRLPHSGIREIVDLALASTRPIVRLEIGEPDFSTPAHVVESAFAAARIRSSYVQTAGIPALREAVGARLTRDYGVAAPLERVVITHGAVQAVDAIMSAVVTAGDEVLIPDPAWPNYEMQAILLGATPVHYGLRAADAFQPDVAEIRSLITPRTRAIVLNSPNNPTGAVMPPETLAAIVALAVENDVLVISDEVYDEIVFEGRHVSAAALAPDHVASVFSFSKTYAMTGWRVGYALLPAWLADTVTRILELESSCVSSVTQAAALAAVTGPQEVVAEMRDAYRSRRDVAMSILTGAGIPVVKPEGAFYLMLPLPDGVDSRLAALELVEAGVSFAPGSAFGRNAPHHLRVSLATSEEGIRDGLARFLTWRETADRLVSAGTDSLTV